MPIRRRARSYTKRLSLRVRALLFTPEIQPDTASGYVSIDCSRKRKFAILDCCTEATVKLKKPNTREAIQRSVEPITEF